MSTHTLILIGRETCHLCHDMHADVQLLIQKHQLPYALEWLDLDDAPELEAQYGLRIPVLLNNAHQILAEGRLDANGRAKLFTLR